MSLLGATIPVLAAALAILFRKEGGLVATDGDPVQLGAAIPSRAGFASLP